MVSQLTAFVKAYFCPLLAILGYTSDIVKSFVSKYYRLILSLLMVLVVGMAFYAGFLEGKRVQKTPLILQCDNILLQSLAIPTQTLAQGIYPEHSSGLYIGSKQGSKYYKKGCAGLARIKPENYIWFDTKTDAELQGYSNGC